MGAKASNFAIKCSGTSPWSRSSIWPMWGVTGRGSQPYEAAAAAPATEPLSLRLRLVSPMCDGPRRAQLRSSDRALSARIELRAAVVSPGRVPYTLIASPGWWLPADVTSDRGASTRPALAGTWGSAVGGSPLRPSALPPGQLLYVFHVKHPHAGARYDMDARNRSGLLGGPCRMPSFGGIGCAMVAEAGAWMVQKTDVA